MSEGNLPESVAAALAKKFEMLKLERLRRSGTVSSSSHNIEGTQSELEQHDLKNVEIHEQHSSTNAEIKKFPEIKEGNLALSESKGKIETDEDTSITPAQRSLLQKVVRRGLVNNRYDLEIQQKDPTSPLYSVKSFELLNLRPELLKGIYQMGFNSPSKIQETALPTLLADPPQNMIAQSQSGTGKTATFLLAMISRVDSTKNYPQALCICPTFELALQIAEQARLMSTYCPEITIGLGVRGEVHKELFTNHIIIGTPGKMTDLSTRMKRINLKKIKVLVLDEADIMINTQGHQEQSVRIIKGLSDNCQIMLFSATYEYHLMRFAEGIIPKPIIIKLRKEEETLDNIKQFYAKAESMDEKYTLMENVYSTLTICQSMVFCQTKRQADQLCQRLKERGLDVGILTGELTIDERVKVLNDYKNLDYNILITTNVLARGIDIDGISLVVNFDIPLDAKGATDFETYLHRIGRTGRFGKSGIAINVVDSERNYEKLKLIENHFGTKITELDVNNLGQLEEVARNQNF